MITVAIEGMMHGKAEVAAIGDDGELEGTIQLTTGLRKAVQENRTLSPPMPWAPVKASVTDPTDFVLSAMALCDEGTVNVVRGADKVSLDVPSDLVI